MFWKPPFELLTCNPADEFSTVVPEDGRKKKEERRKRA
jgi:hypothetical protein